MYKSWSQVDADEANSKSNTVCSPREELNVKMWAWDTNTPSPTKLCCANLQVNFHPGYSAGTSAARGDTPFVGGHDYFWEIKMLTSMYGTDVMVGIGTAQCRVDSAVKDFCSFLGQNKDSWGFSYKGQLHHNGLKEEYGSRFSMNDIVGVHLNTWNGNLSFYLNGKPLGIAYTINCQEVLYPMVCSTAAYSSMKLIYAYSSPTSLQTCCLQSLSVQQLNLLSSVPGLSRLPRQQLLDCKGFGLETSSIPVEKLAIVQDTDFLIYDTNEDNSNLIKNIFNVRQRKRKLNVNKVLTEESKDRNISYFNYSLSASSSGHSNVKDTDGCKNCGAKYRRSESNSQSLRPLTRQQVANSLCNNCSIIL